jgi:AcrR family transcriptional regulator
VKTARTREHIVDVAIELFVAQGYDQTTMEQIAEKAEVAASTLYRYFTSKDLLILDRLLVFTDLGGELAARPPEEPPGESLAVVIRDSLESFVDGPRIIALRQVIDGVPALRARILDLGRDACTGLERALAERMALPYDDLHVIMTARMALQVYEIAAERWLSGDRSASRTAILNDILVTLAQHDVILPTPFNRTR